MASACKVLRVRVCGQWFRPFAKDLNANCYIFGAEGVRETRINPFSGERQVRMDLWGV